MRRFEASKLDQNLDRAGKHGREGSITDRRKDAKMVKDLNTKYTKTAEKQVKKKGMLPKIGHSGHKAPRPGLDRGAPEMRAKGGKLPGKAPGKRMGGVAKAAHRGVR
jgi:hypothetical protein